MSFDKQPACSRPCLKLPRPQVLGLLGCLPVYCDVKECHTRRHLQCALWYLQWHRYARLILLELPAVMTAADCQDTVEQTVHHMLYELNLWQWSSYRRPTLQIQLMRHACQGLASCSTACILGHFDLYLYLISFGGLHQWPSSVSLTGNVECRNCLMQARLRVMM